MKTINVSMKLNQILVCMIILLLVLIILTVMNVIFSLESVQVLMAVLMMHQLKIVPKLLYILEIAAYSMDMEESVKNLKIVVYII